MDSRTPDLGGEQARRLRYDYRTARFQRASGAARMAAYTVSVHGVSPIILVSVCGVSPVFSANILPFLQLERLPGFKPFGEDYLAVFAGG